MQIFWEVWNYLTSVDGAKFLSAIAACVTILSGGYAFLKAYRYGERQIGQRLAEFLTREEERLSKTREALSELVRRPNPSRENLMPVFPHRRLNRALRRMGWGWWNKEDNLAAAAKRSEQQISLAQRQGNIHAKERALVHLLLGAVADARSDHATAFAEFEKALQLDEGDVEAREYAGLQLLKLGNAIGASEHFGKLAAIAEECEDRILLARAYRQQSLAYEQLGALKSANDALVWAVEAMPSNTDPLEAGYTHEQHGRVRRKAGYDNANDSLQQALVKFSGLSKTTEGRRGVGRITHAIKELNDERQGTLKGDVAPTAQNGVS